MLKGSHNSYNLYKGRNAGRLTTGSPLNPSAIDTTARWISSPAPPLKKRGRCQEHWNGSSLLQALPTAHSQLKVSGWRMTILDDTQVVKVWYQEAVPALLSFWGRQCTVVPNKAHLTGNFLHMNRLSCQASRRKTIFHCGATAPMGEMTNPARLAGPMRTPQRGCPNWVMKG